MKRSADRPTVRRLKFLAIALSNSGHACGS
jgi:hypothetical protein